MSYGDLVSKVESPWEDEAITAMHKRNLRVSFTWMPAPSVFGWPKQRQRAILEQAAGHFDAGDLRVKVGAGCRPPGCSRDGFEVALVLLFVPLITARATARPPQAVACLGSWAAGAVFVALTALAILA